MPRLLSWGLPGGADRKAHRYVYPRSAFVGLRLVFLLGGSAFSALLLAETAGRYVPGVRSVLQPGPLAEKHATGECEACHVPARGVSNARCRRCHDESGPGRMTQVAHVGRHLARLGAADPRQLERTRDLECVRCHVEHAGRRERLVRRDDGQCVACHGERRQGPLGPRPRVSSFPGHPEFRLLDAGKAPRQATGIYFSHKVHLGAQVRRQFQQFKKTAEPAERPLCEECHRMEGQGSREFEPVVSDAHCIGCHNSELKMERAPAADLLALDSLKPPECVSDDLTQCEKGQLVRSLEHKDPWLLRSAGKLRRELYPEEHAAAYARVLSEVALLRRRLYLSQPLAFLSTARLLDRREAFASDLEQIEARLLLRERAQADQSGGFARLDEVVAASEAAGSAGALELRALIEPLRAASAPAALEAAAFQQRREEIFELLDRVTGSDAAPALKARAAYLRLRLLSLLPDEPAREGLRRAAEQRREDLARVEDEAALRARGIAASEVAGGGKRLEEALQEAEARLRELRELDSLPEASVAERERKERTLQALLGSDHQDGCAKCHRIRKGTIGPAFAARPVLTLSAFSHEPHLRAAPPPAGLLKRLMSGAPAADASPATCGACHRGIEASTDSAELHIEPIASCRDCHAAGAQREDCVLCHRYHPPTRP